MYKVLDNNERLFQIKFLTGTRKTVLINEKSCREVPDKEYDGVLFELCCAISEIEAEGHIITSVVELCEDGSTPRVAFRNTKEYRAAKQVQDTVLQVKPVPAVGNVITQTIEITSVLVGITPIEIDSVQ